MANGISLAWFVRESRVIIDGHKPELIWERKVLDNYGYRSVLR